MMRKSASLLDPCEAATTQRAAGCVTSATTLPESDRLTPSDPLDRAIAGALQQFKIARPKLQIGHSLESGRLRILRQIGEGGAGVVYEAYDAARQESVALKELARAEAQAIYRFKQEFRALQTIVHPNVARLHELFTDQGRWFFTMDLVAGVTFDRWVRPNGVLHEQRLREALRELVHAVKAIHAAEKLHRDLKPSNVLVSAEHGVVVLDFGLAIDRERGGIGQTIDDANVSGTPAYMAPEQAGGGVVTAASDLYALGVMLYEALTGRLPFIGGAITQLCDKQRCDAPAPDDPQQLLPADLSSLCVQLMARMPSDRPSLATLEAALAPQAGVTPSSGTARQRSAGLVGREAELAVLRDAHAAAQLGRGNVVVVSGESGIGKTALCEAFLGELREQGQAWVLAGRCYERERVPFKALDALVDALSRQLRRVPEHLAASLLPRHAAGLGQLFPVLSRIRAVAEAPRIESAANYDQQRRAFDAFHELLQRCRDRWPLVLCIDDLQWTDRDSVTLLRHCLLQAQPIPMLLILVERDHGALSAAVIEAAAANRALQLRRLSLSPLSAAEAGVLAARLLPEDMDRPAISEVIAREAAGNPWFVSALAAHAHSAAPLRSLSDWLSAQLEALSPGASTLARLLALAGHPMPAATALAAAKASYSELDELCATRLARSALRDGLAKVECSHDRVREFISAELLTHDRKALYAALAGAWSTRDDYDPEQLAAYYEGAGAHEDASRYAERAAARAVSVMAFDRAAALYGMALRLGSHIGSARTALVVQLADALANAGRGAEAATEYRRAAAWTTFDRTRNLDLRRRAADQLLSAGHAGEGLTLLRELCAETGVVLPANAAWAKASFLWLSARVRFRGLQPRSTPVGTRSPSDSLRLDMARSAVTGLLIYLPSHAACMAVRYLWMTLEAGDETRLLHALGQTAYVALQFNPRGAWSRELIEQMKSLSDGHPDPQIFAFTQGAAGASAYRAAEFREARNKLRGLIQLGRERVEPWTIDAAYLFDQLSAFQCGDYAEIARATPPLIDEAFRRGRVWCGAVLSGIAGMPTGLTFDDPARCRALIAEANRHWKPMSEPAWPDYFLCLAEAITELYAGQPAKAFDLLEQRRDDFARTMLSKGKSSGNLLYPLWRGSCAVAALHQAGGSQQRNAAQWRSALRESLAALRASPRSVWRAEVAKLQAAEALHGGRSELAAERLRTAIDLFDESGVAMVAAAARRRLGQLLGGDTGGDLLAQADSFMCSQGVTNRGALTDTLCPGLG